MEKIRHDSSYEWLSGESWKEWSASFFSMGWKIWGVVLITELFLFLFNIANILLKKIGNYPKNKIR